MSILSLLGPCTTTSVSKACIRVAAIITLVHERDVDDGVITYSLLSSSERATVGLNSESLKVYYAGDEPLDTTMVITLAGVPKRRMGMKQIEYFSKQTKSFLERANADNDVVEILSVDIEAQSLQFESNEIDSSEKEIPKTRLLEEDTTSIDLTTVVTGKHRPPSPGLDFDTLIEDSINADTSSFKEELMRDATNEEGGSYFQYVEGVRVSQTRTLAPTPTAGPTSPNQILVYDGVDPYEIQGAGLGLVAIVLIVVVASIFAFACVFGTFIWKRRQIEQKRFKMEAEPEGDEEDPLFYDIFRSRNDCAKKAPSHSNPTIPNNKAAVCDDQSRRSDHTPDTGILSDQSTDNNLYRASYAQEVMVYEDDDDNDVDSFVVTSRPSLERRTSSSRRRSSQSSAISSGIVSSVISSESDDEFGEGSDNYESHLESTHHTSNHHSEYDHEAPIASRNSHARTGGYSASPEMRSRYNSHYEREESIASISTSSTLSTQGPIPGQSLSRR